MRPLEIAVTIALLPYVLHLLSPSRGENALFSLLPFVAVSLAVPHVLAEGYRWQMFPAYCLVIVFVAYESIRWIADLRAPYFAGVAALLFLFATIALSTALPVFKIPVPTGRYKVGTQSRHIVDERRRDTFSDYSGGPRELMIQIWYPVDPSAQGQIAPYRDKRTTTLRDARYALVKTHSVLGAQPATAQSRYPLLLYAPSWEGLRTESTFLMEELASHGYVVVGIDHPYSSRITVFPDGRIARRKFVGQEDYSSQAAFDGFINTANEQVDIRVSDARFVLDTLEQLNGHDPNGLLTGRLDFDRVGIFGFSFGGTTAAEACWLDRRFKAGLDMGGMIAGASATQGTFAPFFFLFEGLYEAPPYVPGTDRASLDPAKQREIRFTREQFKQMKRSLAEYGGYWMTIDGMMHGDFSDSPFTSPLRSTRADPETIARVIGRYLVAFFDEQLTEVEQPLFDGLSPGLPGIRFQAWKARVPSGTPGR